MEILMKMKFIQRAALALLVLTVTGSVSAADALPAAAGSWQALIEDHSANAFRGWKSDDFPSGWQVAGGVISKDGDVDDLVTKTAYGNFELEVEWKIGKAGNSGIFYHGTREYDHIYWSAPEYQLLDDANAPDGRKRLTSAAAAYSLYPPPAGVVHAFGEWNSTRIVVNGAHVEHWLNGQKVVSYELWSADWKAKIAASKFSAYPDYGLAKKGYLGIQGDHPGTLSLRNFRIRELP
jgi:Domain of Unknown Function (DUF1080)